MQNNIKIFDTQVAIILSQAYEVFPRSFDIDCENLAELFKNSKNDISIEEHRFYCKD